MEDNRGFPLDDEAEDKDDEHEEDWSSSAANRTSKRRSGDLVVVDVKSPAKKKLRMQPFLSCFGEANSSCTNKKPLDDVLSSVKGHQRTIIHIDADCFYAQVEMILNPSLQNKPLGIQQKHIVVTCNYVARERGLTKLMRLSDAKTKCPDLVLVNGEDLSKYREFSKRVNNLLLGLTPHVERLGLDENFLDVTSLVEERLKENTGDNRLTPVGFVYGDKDLIKETNKCMCGCHQRLVMGSHLASEIRKLIFDQTGLTCCAGISHNKILAKLAGECHKPNQQTILFPGDVITFMQVLPARKIPGVGSSSAKRLQSIRVNSVQDLQSCSLEAIQAEFGDTPLALTLKRLSYGIDDTDVIPSGNPKSISEEDTYYECSTLSDVTKNLKSLNSNLVSRLTDDLGCPQTVRLTIRQGIEEQAGDRRESRQCPLPSKFTLSGLAKDQRQDILLSVALYLFKKLININQPFNIKLLNVCLTKFQKPTKGVKTGLRNFFSNCHNKPTSTNSSLCENDTSESGYEVVSEPGSSASSLGKDHFRKPIQNCERARPLHADESSKDGSLGSFQQAESSDITAASNEMSLLEKEMENTICKADIPSDIDTEVFNSLPEEVQREFMQHWELEQKKKKKSPKQPPATGLLKYFSKS